MFAKPKKMFTALELGQLFSVIFTGTVFCCVFDPFHSLAGRIRWDSHLGMVPSVHFRYHTQCVLCFVLPF